MAMHVPKNLTYKARFNAWVSGICPYCDNRSGIVKETSPTKMVFKCPKCTADNPFTLPRLFK